MEKAVRYRLGLDLGATSLGWCIVQLNEANEPIGLIRMGVRLFRDGREPAAKGKTGASLAVDRRMRRGARRRRDRWLKRQLRFRNALVAFGLMPADVSARKALVSLDPYVLRQRAIHEGLTPHEVGRALFHINQRRGFQSNRKIDSSMKDEEKKKEHGKISTALDAMKERFKESGSNTVGEWLALRHAQRQPVRARLRGHGAKSAYELYVARAMIAHEFDEIWKKQAESQPQVFTPEAAQTLREIIVSQRPLKPIQPGRCTLEPLTDVRGRAPLALPSAQRFRILQELNNLRFDTALEIDKSLTLEQRDLLARLLEGIPSSNKRDKADSKGMLPFENMKRILGLSEAAKFNLESEKRKGLLCNKTSLSLSKPDRFGAAWNSLPLNVQDAIVEKLLDEDNQTEAVAWLREHHGLTEQAAASVFDTGLTDGHSNLGRNALLRVLPKLQENVITYDKAVLAAGYEHHSDLHTGEYFGNTELPYYGKVLQSAVGFGSNDERDIEEKRFGRIANPTVHIGLNQVRRLVNAVMKRYGPPTQIAVEITRQLKQSKAQREADTERQAKNQDANDRFRSDIADLRSINEYKGMEIKDSGETLLRMKLWHELNPSNPLNRCCPYTGRKIGREKLFSDEVQIEHILPFSRTLDDSIANKTLAFRHANDYKKNRTPYDAFGQSLAGFEWDNIQVAAQNMPKNKQWRFSSNAMELFDLKCKEEGGFLARHLNDTAYLSRSAKAYLSYVCHPDDVWVTPGRLTALLRGKWGLNPKDKKDRNDHRHHAIDAAVVAVTDKSLLQKMSTLAAQERLLSAKVRFQDLVPWPEYRDAVKAALPRIVVSYKPDHGHQAGLHNDTVYGFDRSKPYAAGEKSSVVHRVPLATLGKQNINDLKPKQLESIRDIALKERLLSLVGQSTGKDMAAKLAGFIKDTGISRVRVVESLTVIPIHRKQGKKNRLGEDSSLPYKAFKGDANYCVEIYCNEKGRWAAFIVSSFLAAQIFEADRKRPNDEKRLRHKTLTNNDKPLVMRLCQDDYLALGDGEERKIYRVVKLSEGEITAAEHFEAGALKERHETNQAIDPFRYLRASVSALQKAKARRVFVTELGEIFDPGRTLDLNEQAEKRRLRNRKKKLKKAAR